MINKKRQSYKINSHNVSRPHFIIIINYLLHSAYNYNYCQLYTTLGFFHLKIKQIVLTPEKHKISIHHNTHDVFTKIDKLVTILINYDERCRFPAVARSLITWYSPKIIIISHYRNAPKHTDSNYSDCSENTYTEFSKQ